MESKPNAVEAAAAAAPVRKDLKDAFQELSVHSSFLGTFCSLWKDLEDHLSSIDRSIEQRFRELEAGEQGRPASSPVARSLASEMEEAAEVEPRPALKSLCVKMDGKGFLTFIKENRKDPPDIYQELNGALRAAPDPAALVLDVMDAFYPAKRSRQDTFDGGLHVTRRICICLLERLHMISSEIKPAVRERAKNLAAEWEVLTTDAGQNLEALAFLQLLVSYGITSEFGEDDLVDLLVSIAKKKEAVCICRNLGFHTRMADLIQKLSSKGKQLDAVKFIYASELMDKFPPVPLLKAYMKESKRLSQVMQKSGTAKSQKAAISRELDQVKAVIKIVEDYKLQSEYPPELLRKRVAHLERQKAEMRHWTGSATAKAPYQQKEANKRPRTSAVTATAATAPTIAAQQPLLHLPQAQPPLTVGAPYMASTGPYQLSGSIPPYDRTVPTQNWYHDLGPPQPQITAGYLHSDSSVASGLYDRSGYLHSDSSVASGLYDRSGAYASYSLAGGLQPQYNSSLYR